MEQKVAFVQTIVMEITREAAKRRRHEVRIQDDSLAFPGTR